MTPIRYSTCLLLAVLALSARAQDVQPLAEAASQPQPAASAVSGDDLALGRRYLQCGSYWGIVPAVLKEKGQQIDMDKMDKIRDMHNLAALVLMGEERALAENQEEKKRFVQDIKDLGPLKAVEKWTTLCGELVEQTFDAVGPRIKAYLEARSGGGNK